MRTEVENSFKFILQRQNEKFTKTPVFIFNSEKNRLTVVNVFCCLGFVIWFKQKETKLVRKDCGLCGKLISANVLFLMDIIAAFQFASKPFLRSALILRSRELKLKNDYPKQMGLKLVDNIKSMLAIFRGNYSRNVVAT